MVDTFYLHLEFKNKAGTWSINLPFLCSKCGVCCTLDDFLTAGEITAKPQERPDVHAKMHALCEELGKMWEADQEEYDKYIMHNPCPFLVDKSCSIYEIRPDGCRLFPNTAFGMLTQDCEALNRFKKMGVALKKGQSCKEKYYFSVKALRQSDGSQPIKHAKINQKQIQTCILKLRRAGMTDDELALLNIFNGQI